MSTNTNTCAGSGAPVGIAATCGVCGTSFGWPHPAGLVVGALAPVHAADAADAR